MPRIDNQVTGVHLHNGVGRALGVQGEGDAALLAVLLAVAVARVVELVDAARVERDEAEAVRDELIGEDRAVDFDFDKVDGERGDFGLDDSAERIGKGDVCL